MYIYWCKKVYGCKNCDFVGTFGKLALTTSRIRNISSLTLHETSAGGSSRLISLTKCSNAFTCDYNFRPGTFYFQVQGVDSNGVDFTYNFNKSAVITASPESTYSLRSTNTTGVVITLSERFRMEFELHSDEVVDVTFTLGVSTGGFVTAFDPAVVQLQSKQTRNIVLNGHVATLSASIIGTHNLIITATNGCVTLTASREITIKFVVKFTSNCRGLIPEAL